MTATTDEIAAALAIIERAIGQGFHARAYRRDGQLACPYAASSVEVCDKLGCTSLETVMFAAPPGRPGDRYAARGYITFEWGHGPEDVVHDFADNLYMRKAVGEVGDA